MKDATVSSFENLELHLNFVFSEGMCARIYGIAKSRSNQLVRINMVVVCLIALIDL